jgi:TRAP-type C4-dicarboxylate transport system permease small subunit
MKKGLRQFLFVLIMVAAISFAARAQCSICTKTAQQMGERPAKALNGGILYLAAMPFLIFGYIGYRWYKSNHEA